MNRKNLTAAVLAGLAGAAGIAGTAQAVNLNPDGLGQVLIYPYYTSNAGNQTILSVVNTTDQAKAVKVRFLEGFNSREVLDFNLYMSAWDVWVAAIADGGDLGFDSQAGVPHLVIPDNSCTVPYLYGDQFVEEVNGGLQAFLPWAYTGLNEDGGPTSIGRAAEGHFEMIEMGTLTNESEDLSAKPPIYGSATVATHQADTGEPLDCYQLVDNWTQFASGPDGDWKIDETMDIARNSGGLFGGASVINVENGTMFSYNADAIQGFDKSDNGTHFEPGFIFPSLDSGNQNDATVFFGTPLNEAVTLEDYGRGVEAVSAVFMHDNIMNEYSIEAGLNAGTEWIVTFPTKAFYVDEQAIYAEAGVYQGTPFFWIWTPDPGDPECRGWLPGDTNPAAAANPDWFGALDDNGVVEGIEALGISDDDNIWEDCRFVASQFDTAIPPFISLFDGDSCQPYGIEVWNREESPVGDTPGEDIPPVVSPKPPGPPPPPGVPQNAFCFEVNVLRFGDEPVFGTPNFGTEESPYSLLSTITGTPDNGWARINFPLVDNDDPEPDRHIDSMGLVGLPVTGFAAQQYENGFLAGGTVLSNYGGLFRHRASVKRIGPPICDSRKCDSSYD